jgi:hypothetical protein
MEDYLTLAFVVSFLSGVLFLVAAYAVISAFKYGMRKYNSIRHLYRLVSEIRNSQLYSRRTENKMPSERKKTYARTYAEIYRVKTVTDQEKFKKTA